MNESQFTLRGIIYRVLALIFLIIAIFAVILVSDIEATSSCPLANANQAAVACSLHPMDL